VSCGGNLCGHKLGFFMRLFRDILGVLRRLRDGFGGGYGV
jgi:hypothetical protein